MKNRDVIDLLHSFFKTAELAIRFKEDLCKQVGAAIKESRNNKQFMRETGIKSPTEITPDNISLYSATSQMYSVEGLGVETMSRMCQQAKIPHITVPWTGENSHEGQVLVAIPKKYERQANEIFSRQLSLSSHAPGLQTLDDAQQALVKRISHDSDAIKTLVNDKYFTEMETSASHALGLQKRFEENGILCVIGEHTDGKCTMYVPRMFGPQAALLDEQIKRTRPELSRNEFGGLLSGNELLVEHKGVTEAELAFFREKVVESGIQYCVEGTPQGNYTLKYKAQDERYLGQALYSSMMEAGGAKAEARNNYFTQKATISQQVADIGKKHACVIIDAADPSQAHDIYIDSAGMHSMDGKLIMSASSRHFDVAVQAKIQEMAAPMFDQLNKDELANIETRHAQTDFFTKEEIARASEAAALANKDVAAVMASKITTLTTSAEYNVSNQMNANYFKDVANKLTKVADAIEEDGFRMSADEVADTLGVPVDKVDEFVTYMKNENTTRDTRLAIKSHLEQCSSRIDNVQSRPADQRDYRKEKIDKALDAQEQDEIVSEIDTEILHTGP
jgi:hypothetical protein